MWKKIRSDRCPEDTLLSEIRREFRPYFDKAATGVRALLRRFPKTIFGAMIFLMLASLVLTFTLFRHPDQPKAVATKTVVHPLTDGFSRILQAGAQLSETIRLKKLIDSISAKKALSAADSTGLYQALDSLQRIHPILK